MTYEMMKKVYGFARDFDDNIRRIYMHYDDWKGFREDQVHDKNNFALYILLGIEEYYNIKSFCKLFDVKDVADICDEIVGKVKKEWKGLDIDYIYADVKDYLMFKGV
jgi:hypothetical protein